MTEATVPVDTKAEAQIKRKATTNTVVRILRYTIVRLIVLFLTVVIAVYLTILIANMGGYVDKIQRGQIQETISMQLALNPSFKSLSAAEREAQMGAQDNHPGKTPGTGQALRGSQLPISSKMPSPSTWGVPCKWQVIAARRW